MTYPTTYLTRYLHASTPQASPPQASTPQPTTSPTVHQDADGAKDAALFLSLIFDRRLEETYRQRLSPALRQMADDLFEVVSDEINEASEKIVALSKVGGTKILSDNETGYGYAVFGLELGIFENWCVNNKSIVAKRPSITYIANTLLTHCKELDKQNRCATLHFLSQYDTKKGTRYAEQFSSTQDR